MKSLFGLLLAFCTVAAFSQCQPFHCQPTPTRIRIGSLIVGNTNQGVTFFFLHLDAPGTMPYVIDDVVLDVNGKKEDTKSSLGPIKTPTEILFAASNLAGFSLPGPPFDVATVQIHFLNDQPAQITLSDGIVARVDGIQTTAMVPLRGKQFLTLGTTATKGQSIPLYLSVIPAKE